MSSPYPCESALPTKRRPASPDVSLCDARGGAVQKTSEPGVPATAPATP